MTFATAKYSPPEHTPPGWTREQFMDYFAGVVENHYTNRSWQNDFQRWGQTHNKYLAYLPDGFDDLNPVSRIEIMSAIRVAAAHDEEVAMKEMMTSMNLTGGPESKNPAPEVEAVEWMESTSTVLSPSQGFA